MAMDFMQQIIPIVVPWIKFFMIIFVVAVFAVIIIYFIIEKKKRKWHIKIYEQKADGRIHIIGVDVLQEKKLEMGRKTVYWLKKAKQEVIPAPAECIHRYNGKEEIDYLRVQRDFVPCEHKIAINYTDPKMKKAATIANDKLLKNIRAVKTSYFTADGVRDRFIYIPINKTLTATMKFEPIDYDVSMMAMNEIHNADEFYASKYEFWKKYGAIIVFAVTIVFLIILIVLTYEYMRDTVTTIMGQVSSTGNILEKIQQGLGVGKPPG